MKKYRVYYWVTKEEKGMKDIDAEGLFDLVQQLETKYLYREQYDSVYKIKVIAHLNDEGES